VVRLVDPDHHTEEWTFASKQGEETTDLIDLRRVKSYATCAAPRGVTGCLRANGHRKTR
jgi:hypothetical protein